MINKNKLKKTLLLLLTLSAITLNYNKVYAEGGVGTGGGGGGDDSPFNTSGTPSYGSQCDAVRCSYSYAWEKGTDIEIEMKDVKGNHVRTSLFSESINTEFLAGTYVMLRVYQTQYFNSSASYYVKAMRQVWDCHIYLEYEYRCCALEGPSGCDEWTTCIGTEYSGTYSNDCNCLNAPPGGYVVPEWKGWRDVTAEYIDSCAAGAIAPSFDLEPIVVAEYNDSNDINTNNTVKVEGHECPEAVKGKEPDKGAADGSHSGANTLSGECAVSYDREADICINAKNGVVRYLDGQTNGQCNSDEYKLTKDSDGYWKYFIPLNANSANDFKFELKSSGSTEIAEICADIQSKYSYWDNIINMNSDGTCTYETTVTIPIKQRFYNELENGLNFKGFNFYYKPIDINNPFPNGINSTSIWNDSSQTADISKSYDKVTYSANTSGNETEIRNYTKNNPYTSWENMNINGTSNFIKNEGIVTSSGSLNDFYALGCGPKNASSQAECGRR